MSADTKRIEAPGGYLELTLQYGVYHTYVDDGTPKGLYLGVFCQERAAVEAIAAVHASLEAREPNNRNQGDG